MEIVFAESRHLDAIVEIERENFSLPWSKSSFEAELNCDSAVFLAAVEGEKTVGFAILRTFETEGEIYNIAVAAACRRHGTGDKLMLRLMDEASRRGVETVFLDVRESNTAARNMYKKHGFCDMSIRRGYYDAPKEDAVIMIRKNA